MKRLAMENLSQIHGCKMILINKNNGLLYALIRGAKCYLTLLVRPKLLNILFKFMSLQNKVINIQQNSMTMPVVKKLTIMQKSTKNLTLLLSPTQRKYTQEKMSIKKPFPVYWELKKDQMQCLCLAPGSKIQKKLQNLTV